MFQEAVKSSPGLVERNFCIAGVHFCFKFAGPALIAPLTSALAHLACDSSSTPDLTILVWDSDSTNTAPPPPGWDLEDHRERGEIRGFCDERFHTIFQIYVGRLTMIDRQSSTALCWTRSSEDVPLSERGAPFRVLFDFWLTRYGLSMLHSGATGRHDRGVLLAGAGGSGKSNTTLTCLEEGLLYAGDDYCLLNGDDPATVFSLYNSAKLFPPDRCRFSVLDKPELWYQDATSDKALVFLQQTSPEKITRSMPIVAVLLPRVTGQRDTRVRAVSSNTALRTLMMEVQPSSAASMKQSLSNLANLVRTVPCFDLQLGTTRAQIPQVVKELLQQKL